MSDPRAFVVGWPIHHSRSPLIHATWLERFDLAGLYESVSVKPDAIDVFFRDMAREGWRGGNVTIPHKEAAFRFASRRDAAAEAIGAVNTLWFEDGVLVGGNTDAYGFAANLDERLPGWDAAERALVLGAGGAARAVIHALLSRGLRQVHVVNRTPARAEALASAFGARVAAHDEADLPALLAATDLLVNTVPAGATPVPDLAPMPDAAMVADIVYVPLQTPLLAAAEVRGLRTADGLGMLLHQAAPGFEHWFGRRPVVDEALRRLVLADIAASA